MSCNILKKMNIKIKKLNEKAVIPKYFYLDDACMDITAIGKEEKDDYIEYKTGLAFEIPKGYVLLVFPRSSACNYHLIQANCVGVIDSGYRGELIIRHKKVGEKVYAVGERVAQIMIIPYPKVSFVEVDELSETDRGKGNFGSSGK